MRDPTPCDDSDLDRRPPGPAPAPPPQPRTPALVCDPERTIPERRAGSVRRTSHLLMTWPAGHTGDLRIEGRARDLLTPPKGPARTLATAELSVTQNPDGIVTSIEATPPGAAVHGIVGSGPGRGFRRAIGDAYAEPDQLHSLGHFLIEDLTTANLLSTFAWSRDPERMPYFFEESRRPASLVADICSGYRAGGIAIELRRKGADVSQSVAVTTRLDSGGDALAWHEFTPPDRTAMCRRRRMDVWRTDDVFCVDAMFRDNTWDPDGSEAIVHEYGLSATIDVASRTLVSLRADPRVLPYPECPLAADEIERCLGMTVTALRSSVLEELRGIESCTHLNDMLRALAELPSVLDVVESLY